MFTKIQKTVKKVLDKENRETVKDLEMSEKKTKKVKETGKHGETKKKREQMERG